jgi:hypothetical protein
MSLANEPGAIGKVQERALLQKMGWHYFLRTVSGR